MGAERWRSWREYCWASWESREASVLVGLQSCLSGAMILWSKYVRCFCLTPIYCLARNSVFVLEFLAQRQWNVFALRIVWHSNKVCWFQFLPLPPTILQPRGGLAIISRGHDQSWSGSLFAVSRSQVEYLMVVIPTWKSVRDSCAFC